MSEKVEVKLKRGLTPRSLILAIILLIITVAGNTFIVGKIRIASAFWMPRPANSPPLMPLPLLYILALISSLMMGKVVEKTGRSAGLSVQEITFIIAVTYVAVDASTLLYSIYPATLIRPIVELQSTQIASFLPPWWGPKDPQTLTLMTTGGATINWSAWGSGLISWFIYGLTIVLPQIFLATVLRRQVVEVESLPFPHTIPVIAILKATEEGTLLSFKKNKWLYIGFIIGIIYGIIIFINYFSPVPLSIFPGFYPLYRVVVPVLKPILPNAILGWWFSAIDMSIAYLAPTDVTLTAVIFGIILYIIYPVLATNAGIIGPGTNVMWSGPFPFAYIFYIGMPIGMGIFPLLFGYKSIKSSIKRMFSEEGIKAGEIPGKIAITGLALSYLLFIVYYAVAGTPIVIVIPWVILWSIMMLGGMRTYAESGMWNYNYHFYGRHLVSVPITSATGIMPTNPTASTSNYWSFFIVNLTGNSLLGQGPFNTYGYLAGYKVADSTNTRPVDLFWGYIIAAIVIALTGIFSTLFLCYNIGTTVGFKQNVWYRIFKRYYGAQTSFITSAGSTLSSDKITWIWTGAILAGIILFLKTRFIWFFINPVGLVLIGSSWFFFNVVLAGILKYITIKIGGAKLFENVTSKVVSGFMIGASIIGLIAVLYGWVK